MICCAPPAAAPMCAACKEPEQSCPRAVWRCRVRSAHDGCSAGCTADCSRRRAGLAASVACSQSLAVACSRLPAFLRRCRVPARPLPCHSLTVPVRPPLRRLVSVRLNANGPAARIHAGPRCCCCCAGEGSRPELAPGCLLSLMFRLDLPCRPVAASPFWSASDPCALGGYHN